MDSDRGTAPVHINVLDMAKLNDLFAFSGRLGDLVGCKGPNGFYLRSRPRKSRKPPTAKQLEVRARLALVMRFLKPLKEIIYEGFSNKQLNIGKMSSMNAASSHLLNQGLEGSYPDMAINPAAVRLSRGNLVGLANVQLHPYPDRIDMTWLATATHYNGYSDDWVRLVCYNPAERSVVVNEAIRSEGALTVDVSEEPPGSELLLYCYVADRDGKQFSTSQFLGTVRVF